MKFVLLNQAPARKVGSMVVLSFYPAQYSVLGWVIMWHVSQ